MRLRRIVFALLVPLAFAVPAAAQSNDSRISLNAVVGPSFANVGTTFSTTAGLDVKLNDRTTLVGEFGIIPRAPFSDASEIAPPAVPSATRVNAYHWNGNVKVRPFEVGRFTPYVTGGIGSFTSDTVMNDDVLIGPARFKDRRTSTDFATNVGAGVHYQLNDWVGVGADYRTFFVHRDESTPRVHRFSTGLTFSLK